MTDAAEPTTVSRNDDEARYEIHLGDVLAGYTEFEVAGDAKLIFPHTVIDPAFRGRGLAGILVSEAMTDVARRGETVVPVCPVVRRWLRENQAPEGLRIEWPRSVPEGGGGV